MTARTAASGIGASVMRPAPTSMHGLHGERLGNKCTAHRSEHFLSLINALRAWRRPKTAGAR